MDINLKDNTSLNLRILILGACITMLPIILGICITVLHILSGIYNPFYILGKGCLILLYISIIIFLINILKKNNLIFKEIYITRLYSRMFLEVRILLEVLMIDFLFELYELFYYDELFSDRTLIIFIVTFILTYFTQIDIYKLYLLDQTNELKNYIQEKSMIYKLYKLMKECFLVESTSSKMLISIIVFIMYVILIYVIGYSTEGTLKLPYIFLSIKHNILMVIVLAILPTLAIIIYLIYIFRDINRINISTYNIATGNYNNKIEVKEPLFLKDIAKNIMDIENGLGKAIDKAVKSEKMKGELITNVSHDLKTPLTSIINYVDLLDNDNISEERRKLYLGILKERSLRLKILIEDLFEASKAASGTLEMHMEILDPVALIRQTLGEFEDKIKVSNLNFIKIIPHEKLTIYADGKRTFRVFQNLISNIIKYSLKGTRVYIDIKEEFELVSITFKNISEYPLNFTEEEILERFKRGDSSRATDGSGLGLSIAKNLVELQSGKFKIKFDGDLFKVIVLLKKQNF